MDAICKKYWKSMHGIFYSGKSYEITDIRYFERENWYKLKNNENVNYSNSYIPNWLYKQYFFTKSEIRKFKLEKLAKIFNI